MGRLPPAATSALLRSPGHPTSNCGLGRQRSGHLGSKGQGEDGAWCCVHTEREGGGRAGGRAQAGRPKPLPGARSAHWYHSPAPGYVNSGMSIFSRRRFHPDPRQRAGCEGPPAPHLAVSRDLDPRQAQDRGGGLYQICTRLNRPPRINWHPRKPGLPAGGGY